MNQSIGETRRNLVRRLFPEGVSPLWCPPISHYLPDGGIDRARTEAHLAHLAPHVGGLLAAGSTSDGWELDAERHRLVTQMAIEAAGRFSLRVLIGVLRRETQEVLDSIADWMRNLAGTAAGAAGASRLANRRVSGFTVCGPVGADLPEGVVEACLTRIFQTGAPIALYQLPQVTGYELSPELVSGLATRFGNFLVFKDSSGADRVALSRRGPSGVFLLRGAEGDYARWLAATGGPYHGFLLSSANSFPAELRRMIQLLQARDFDAARVESDRVTAAMKELFAIAGGIQGGNPFANSNKLADHVMAYGERAEGVTPPRFSTGEPLPVESVRAALGALRGLNLMPTKGYLEKSA